MASVPLNYIDSSDIFFVIAKENTNVHILRSLKYQTLLADISQNLMTLDNFSEKLDNIIRLLGINLEVSRTYIFENSKDGLSSSNTYEWCNVGIEPQKEHLQNLGYDLFPSWKPYLEKHGKIQSNNLAELPKDIYDLLSTQNIQSILVLPLIVNKSNYGFMGFDECTEKREWTSEEIDLLRTISGIISSSFERRKLIDDLRESEQRWQFSVDGSELGLWDWNIPEGTVFFSKKWKTMLGYEEDEIKNQLSEWKNRVHSEDWPKVMEDISNYFEGKSPFYENEHRVKCKDGSYKWILDRGKIIEWTSDNKPYRMIGTHSDVTLRHNQMKELTHLNATKDKLFSIIAHDLRSPMSTMMQLSELLVKNKDITHEDVESILESQMELSKSTFELLDNLLYWATFNQQSISFNPQPIKLRSVIDNSLSKQKYQLNAKEIEFCAQCPFEMEVYADENMLRLVFRNLLSNAIKFTHEKGKIEFSCSQKNEQITVSISDSGVGISPEDIEKILSKNNYYTSPGTKNEKGTGVGLKLCQEFIEQCNGTFEITSIVGKGTTISVTLPAYK